GVLLTIIA
ncbi:hypothetical protein ECEC1870_3354, partial [Escherichia coli EC1870]